MKLKVFGLFVVATLVLSSCRDEVTVANTNGISIDNFFNNKSQIESAAASVYAHLQTPGLYQRFGYILPDTFSDEMFPSGDPNFKPSYDFNIAATLDQTRTYWTQSFAGVAKANFLIANEDKMRENLGSSDFTEADINNAVGEGYFMRGFFYYLIVKRYGGVPIYTQEDFGVSDTKPRATEDEVYAQIIADFKSASELLFEKGTTQNGRATKGAALGMLGKVYLHRDMLTEAKAALDQISGYNLLPASNYTDNFNESGEFNDESMFEVNFSGENNPSDTWSGNGQGTAEITFHAQEYSGWGNARPSTKMISEFEVDDPRKKLAILENGDTFGPGNAFTHNGDPIWYKFSQLYENQNIVPEGDTNTRVLRYADVLLLQAEVANKLGDDSNSQPGALFYLNQLRRRFSLPEYGSATMDARGFPVGTPAQVFSAIVHERMVELCAEQHRFDDLIRWGLDGAELALDNDGNPRGYNPAVHKFMPIPQTEIDTNPNISQADQNPGF